ncbi:MULTISPECIES: GatB/YqeY domain-containing protein [unclassified Lactobacillus]|uniref:GatB/YqeY domain-containing protein n=1 Tax=unclassified Lactobacillus TaxID=2620435 RepID=UPI0018DE0885|nr:MULTISPECIES: GatB/YqeY domain-containing protein [unclassified Lactobacillus]MBH9989257.1 GatB/YqeY domain-containing protein [Lactobacillus sp. M0392]MBI0023868.1 GatB/YqeY domain-containing protein [Lactobacillus sp. W8171]MBI0044298.1 GatB/YqeY domain-containing protein [Lactobacillus sp. M0393]
MSLSEQIMSDMKDAMKARDKVKLNTVRMIKAALMNEKIKAGHDLTADEELTVLSREKKQREESIAEFTKANRDDLVGETKQELAIVENYLPKQMTDEELNQAVSQAISETEAKGKSDFGKVMKALMPKIKGKADGKAASNAVRKQLG